MSALDAAIEHLRDEGVGGSPPELAVADDAEIELRRLRHVENTVLDALYRWNNPHDFVGAGELFRALEDAFHTR